MGGVSQAGMIFHETLRRLQLVYKIPITNEEIQVMTYYAFRGQLGSHAVHSIGKAEAAYAKVELQLFGEVAELMLADHADKWLRSELTEITGKFDMNSCHAKELSKINEKSVSSIYGDWIVCLDEISSVYDLNSQPRKKLDYLRRIIELQLFNPNVLSLWNTWEDFPGPGHSTNFIDLSTMFNSPDTYFRMMSEKMRSEVKRIMTEEAHRLKKEIIKYFYLHYF
jgi:hypothetical protein